MKILNPAQIHRADQYTIENEPIGSIDLMERASKAFIKKLTELISITDQGLLIFCGTGNNGGDGLAIARLLQAQQRNIRICTIGNLEKGSPDFKINLDLLPKDIEHLHLQSIADFPEIESDNCLVIDGIFGSGLSRPVKGLHAELIDHVNNSKVRIVSIDIASGLFADKPVVGDAIVQPDHTISFQVPKLAFMQPSLHHYVGRWHIVDIGLNPEFIDTLDSDFSLTESEKMWSLIPVRKKFNHKGDAGRLLIIAGSKGKMGVAILAAGAAFRAGVGLVYLHSPACGLDILQTSTPEAMVFVDKEEEMVTGINIDPTINAIAVGPGIGTNEETAEALYQLILQSSAPLVLDADALNILAKHPEWLHDLPEDSILTPHPGEFKRLVGKWEDDFIKLEKLRSICEEFKLNIVLKGANSAVCNKEGIIYFNPTGNPGMATAGSGDVLTGIIGALLAQGLKPFNALRLGVYLHGQAGDVAAQKYGEVSLKASDIIETLPLAISELLSQ